MSYDYQETKALSDRQLRSWIRCRRKAWLDLHGNEKERLWSPHKTLQLDHQKTSFSCLVSESIGVGLKGCKEGKNDVFGLRLKGTYLNGEVIEAHPPLIQKFTGLSQWGEYAYRPVIARQGKNTTREHRLLLALSGYLIGQFQKAPVLTGLVVCKTEKTLEIEHLKLHKGIHKDLNESLNRLLYDLQLKDAPPITSNRKKCSICCWRKVCNTEAERIGHLSQVSGIGAKRREMLQKSGVNNIEKLATCNPENLKEKLNKYGEHHGAIADKIISQALAQVSGKEIQIKRGPSFPELKDCPGVLIYDIESDPDAKHDFLHGFIRIKRSINGELDIRNYRYIPILNINNQEEKSTWERINKKMNKYREWPILHYGETEILSIYKIAKRQGLEPINLITLQSRFINVHDRLKKYWYLPLSNYGLKTVAKWLRFSWSGNDLDGSKALLWWRQWKKSRRLNHSHSNNLKCILKYNKEDCIATFHIVSWMIEKEKKY